MFDFLPENLYSRNVVRWGIIASVLFIAAGVFAIHQHDYADAIVDVVLGAVTLFLWGTRGRGLPQRDSSGSSPK